jgi:formylglycine-generating enzyme required for sulfatase activity
LPGNVFPFGEMSISTLSDRGGTGGASRVRDWRAGMFAGLAVFVGALGVALSAAEAPLEGKNHTLVDLKLDLIWVEAGTFLMGSPPDEEGRHQAEGPQTRVTLSRGFWLGRTELTQAQYQALTGTNPSRFTTVGPEAPVERVSWLEAMELCEKLTERERAAGRLPDGFVYSLPTEAQWEYACRAGTTGPTAGDLPEMSWYELNSDETTHPVAQLAPNRWGFFDLSGNVLEWCFDWYGNYPGGSVTDPAGPAHGHFRMARGGSWRTRLDVGRSAARAGGSPGRQDYTIGLRLALVPVR